jgi:hypothetical protein
MTPIQILALGELAATPSHGMGTGENPVGS